MRFHHSTRRGRTKFSQGGGPHSSGGGGGGRSGAASSHSSLSNRWAQLSYCRQTNIHFNRRLPVEVPDSILRQQAILADQLDNQNRQQSAKDAAHLIDCPSLFSDAEAISSEHTDIINQKDLPVTNLTSLSRQHHHNQAKLEQQLSELKLTTATSGDDNNTIKADQLVSSRSMTLGASTPTNSKSSTSAGSKLSSKRTMRLFHQDSKTGSSKISSKTTTTTTTNSSSGSSNRLRPATSDNLSSSSAALRKLDIESAREKLIEKVEKHPFWSNKAAKRMRLLDIDERRILIYELVSYCEKRDLEWRYEPYRGGLVAGTGPFSGGGVGGGSVGGGVGVRRVLSSVGERVPPPFPATPIGPDTSTSGRTSKLPGSMSQPASPQRNGAAFGIPIDRQETIFARQLSSTRSNLVLQQASPPPQYALDSPTLTVGQQQHRFSYEESPPPHSRSIGSPLAFASRNDATSNRLDKSRRQSAFKRSCSSAATSPIQLPASSSSNDDHNNNNSSSNSNLLLLASLDGNATTAAGTSGSLLGQSAFGEPRPLPSAELVWSIEPPEHLRPAPFVSYIHTTPVPDTSFVKRCHGCQGRGRLKCTSCYGVGYEVCISCSGKGTMKSLAASGASSAAGAAGSHASGQHHHHSQTSGASVGSMWSNAPDSSDSGRYGASRHDEPGGITGGGGGHSSGLGAWTTESCHLCHGAGQKRCWICGGRAYNTCTACAGTGQLRCYLNLNITWMNHRDECVLNNTDSIIPRDRLKLSSGLLLADEIGARLKPLASDNTSTGRKLLELARARATSSSASGAASCQQFQSTTVVVAPPSGELMAPSDCQPDGVTAATAAATPTPTSNSHSMARDGATLASGQQQQVAPSDHCDERRPQQQQQQQHSLEQVVKPSELSQLHLFSSKLLDKHWLAYGRSEKLLMQRHRVTQIECFLVNWEWKRRRGHFVVYGDERKVYIAKYPFKSICNIT